MPSLKQGLVLDWLLGSQSPHNILPDSLEACQTICVNSVTYGECLVLYASALDKAMVVGPRQRWVGAIRLAGREGPTVGVDQASNEDSWGQVG